MAVQFWPGGSLPGAAQNDNRAAAASAGLVLGDVLPPGVTNTFEDDAADGSSVAGYCVVQGQGAGSVHRHEHQIHGRTVTRQSDGRPVVAGQPFTAVSPCSVSARGWPAAVQVLSWRRR